MESFILTQLTSTEVGNLLRQELERYFSKPFNDPINSKAEGPINDELLTIESAAELLSISKGTIYNLVSNKAIPNMKRGRRLYFLKSDLISWLKDSRRGTKTEANHEADRYLAGIKKGGK